jgi:DNA-binding CsgD family transcriptional regulator
MGILRVLYWGAAYTTGIICATVFIIRYFQKRDSQALSLFAFLVPFGVSIACLSIMEGAAPGSVVSSLVGYLALVGASLVAAAFPGCALGFEGGRRRARVAAVLRALGLAFAGLNVLDCFFRTPADALIEASTFVLLGFAIFIGMSWIARGSIKWESRSKPALMAVLFVFFGLVMVVDFLRGLFPPLRFLGSYFILLPAFYAYLNVFLVVTHFRDWERERKASEKSGPSADLLGRHGISDREREVLALLSEGRTYREMADALCVSLATIKSHVSHLYDKTGTRNKVELINLLYDSKGPRLNQPKSG